MERSTNRSIAGVWILAVCLAGLLISLSGCTQEEQSKALEVADQRKALIDRELAAETEALNKARAQLEAARANPGADPKVIDNSVKVVETLQHAVDEARKYSDEAQKVLNDLKAGQVTPEGTLAVLRRIPGVGPYADLIALLGGIGYGVLQRRKAQAVVEAWTNESPVGENDAIKAARAKHKV